MSRRSWVQSPVWSLFCTLTGLGSGPVFRCSVPFFYDRVAIGRFWYREHRWPRWQPVLGSIRTRLAEYMILLDHLAEWNRRRIRGPTAPVSSVLGYQARCLCWRCVETGCKDVIKTTYTFLCLCPSHSSLISCYHCT